MTHPFSRVGIVGFGTMGSGIAEVVARSGRDVVVFDISEPALDAGRHMLEVSLQHAVEGGKITPGERQETLDRIEYSTALSSLADCELVVEATPERLELKRAVFIALDEICKPDAVLATNTSSLSVTEIAVATGRPGKVIGLHFFNPAPVMKLVEIVPTVVTEPGVAADVVAFARSLGKQDVTAGDRSGFITNALLFGYLNHAATLYETKVATREDIDAAMRLGCGIPMGPLMLLDLIGLDTAFETLEAMYEKSRDRLHAPAPILKQLTTAGLVGRKTGRGFYTYAAPNSHTPIADDSTPAHEPASAGAAGDVTRIGVVGSGTMASGIVEVCAKAGYAVTYVARSADKADGVASAVERSLGRAVDRGKLSATAKTAALAQISGTTTTDDLGECDVIIEAVVENLDVKRTLFREIDRVAKPGAVLATTTSSLSVMSCAAATSRPEAVIGMHFFNPAAVMKLVEVVTTVATAPSTAALTLDLVGRLGKHAVRCADRPGFIVNALLFPYLNDAVKMLESNYGSATDIDLAMTAGCGYPLGPFALLDVVGLDVSLEIQRTLHREFREPGFAPAPLLENLVSAGRLGRKSGEGFGNYK